MLASRLSQRIERNWEKIAAAVIAARDQDPALPHYRNLSDQEIRERVRDLTVNLNSWLTTRDETRLGAYYEDLGRRRQSEGMPLHELVLKLTTIKRAIRTYATEQNFNLTALEIYDELELMRNMGGYFDFIICHVVKGYEQGRNSLPQNRGRAA
jgi:hypothetical protein